MSFGTVVSCMDGRLHLTVINYLQDRFGVDYIDKITEAGPIGIISKHPDGTQAESIFRLVDISINSHASQGLAIVAHHDCAGNPIPDADQKLQLQKCLGIFAERYPGFQIIGLWLDEELAVHDYSTVE